jgi:hypothetical protein
VRNPDWAADRLIGPAELALIADHPISRALDQDFQTAMNDPAVTSGYWLAELTVASAQGTEY